MDTCLTGTGWIFHASLMLTYGRLVAPLSFFAFATIAVAAQAQSAPADSAPPGAPVASSPSAEPHPPQGYDSAPLPPVGYAPYGFGPPPPPYYYPYPSPQEYPPPAIHRGQEDDDDDDAGRGKRKSRGMMAVGIVLTSLGGVGTLAGVVWAAVIADRHAEELPAPIGLTVAGALCVAFGVPMIIIGARREKQPGAEVVAAHQVRLGPAGASWRSSF